MASSLQRSRIIQVGPSTVVFESLDAEIVGEFDALFSGFAQTDSEERPDVLVQISAKPGEDGARIYDGLVDGVVRCRRVNKYELALQITRLLNRHVLDNEPDRLHLHAGAVTRGTTTVLVLGSSFSGKSTLVAALVERGWSYLSDEQIGVTPAGELVPYPRPITLRSGSWPFFDADWFPEGDLAMDRIEVSPKKLGDVYSGPAIAPTIVVCPDASEPRFACQELTSADAVARLLSDTLDLERAGSAGVDAMLSIAAQAPTFLLHGRDLDVTCAKIDELSFSAQPPGGPIEQAAVGADETDRRRVGALSWLFADESAAIYDPNDGAFLQLDHAGYLAWELVAQDPKTWPAGMADSQFLAELQSAGLLSQSEN